MEDSWKLRLGRSGHGLRHRAWVRGSLSFDSQYGGEKTIPGCVRLLGITPVPGGEVDVVLEKEKAPGLRPGAFCQIGGGGVNPIFLGKPPCSWIYEQPSEFYAPKSAPWPTTLRCDS